jgi:toxin ParE1/3/4
LNDAADYYDRESPGLGSTFLDEVDSGFDRIRAYPDAAAEVARGIRKLVFARFPYALVYEVRNSLLELYGLVSIMRNSLTLQSDGVLHSATERGYTSGSRRR